MPTPDNASWIKTERRRVSGQAVAWIWIARVDVRNAFDDVLIRELEQAFARLSHDKTVRAVVLAAEGKAFCAGADLGWMKRSAQFSFEENVHDAQALAKMLKAIHSCPHPVIGRLQGSAFGGGLGLIAACDIAVAVKDAKFCFSEAKLGLIPAVISPYVLQKMDMTSAKWAFLTADVFSADVAKQMGLLYDVVADETALDDAITKLLTAIVANGPEALTHCKILLGKLSGMDWQRAMDLTAKLIAERRTSAEGQEGMAAFLEKRPPAWQALSDKGSAEQESGGEQSA